MTDSPVANPVHRRLQRCRFAFASCAGLLSISRPTAAETHPAELAAASLEQLARWGQEWSDVAEAEAQASVKTGSANSMIKRDAGPGDAAVFLDCGPQAGRFWSVFRDAFSATGPLSAQTGTLAYLKWSKWEAFIDGMDFAGAWDGRAVVPLAGEFDAQGFSLQTRVHSKRDWIKVLQHMQWQMLYGKAPDWSEDNLAGFLNCPVGFAVVQYVIFLVHKIRSNLPPPEAQTNLDGIIYAFAGLFSGPVDHLESSSWNISSFDLAVNMNLKTGENSYFESYDQYFRMRPTPLPRLTSWREDWSEHKSWLSPVACRTWGRARGTSEDSGENLRVAFVGEHGPSNLEHLSALTAALADATGSDACNTGGPPVIDAGHFFTYLWSLGGTAEGDLIQKSLRMTWEAFWGEPLTA
ncbi:unnamed protein product, partial [Polarella glacialis]